MAEKKKKTKRHVNKYGADIFIPRRVQPMDSFTDDEVEPDVLKDLQDKGFC